MSFLTLVVKDDNEDALTCMYVTRKDVKEGKEGIAKEENKTVTLILQAKKVNWFLNMFVFIPRMQTDHRIKFSSVISRELKKERKKFSCCECISFNK